MSAKEHLIVALDVPAVQDAEAIIERLGNSVDFYKIGYQLAFAGGLELARDLVASGNRVFLDMKLHDIDNTVAKGIENITRMGVQMTTVHAYPKTMRAAQEAAQGTGLCVLGVTVLTSMDDADVAAAGYSSKARDLVLSRAADAKDVGLGGVVASAKEAASIRDVITSDMAIVTPGIRPAGTSASDQKRVMTPSDALSAGATHLVVGRPITAADDPKASAHAILSEMATTSL